MLSLRPYQEHVVAAVYEHLRGRDDNPCAVVPTAGGKTPIMATICKDAVEQWNGRVLILAHVKELLEQTADKLRTVCPGVEFGIYSAGLKRREIGKPVTVAGIQSVYRRACEMDPFDLVMIDEAHLIPLEGDGMYRQFLSEARVVNPNLRVIGFTATPFRLKSGPICTPDGVLNHVCYEVGVRELIRDGYLCPLVTKAGTVRADTSGLHVRQGEFVADEVESLMDQDAVVEAACDEIVVCTADRQSCLIFASGIRHGKHVVEVLRQRGVECGFVSGETPDSERNETLEAFKAGSLKYLCNVNVLTTGFDAPRIDCVVMLRPTMSAGLYYQMVGRGFRLHPDKRDCLILDYGGNVVRHGPVDSLSVTSRKCSAGPAPVKECPVCHAIVPAGCARCSECGHAFPPREATQHESQATAAGILSCQFTDTEHKVLDTVFSVHTKRGADEDAPRTFRVDYCIGFRHWQSEYICVEHSGFARCRASRWWKQRSPDPMPLTADEAVVIAEAGGLACTDSIVVRTAAGEKYGRIVSAKLGPMPEAVTAGDEDDSTEVPF